MAQPVHLVYSPHERVMFKINKFAWALIIIGFIATLVFCVLFENASAEALKTKCFKWLIASSVLMFIGAMGTCFSLGMAESSAKARFRAKTGHDFVKGPGKRLTMEDNSWQFT